MKLSTAVWTALGLTGTAVAQFARYSPPNEKGVSYSVNVPAGSASSGSSDIYFQIKGPASLQWVALGQGSQMAGSNMFIVYADASGSNVTLSPRLSKGEVMPNYDPNSRLFLLDGSGIANNVMTANVRCSSCATWQGGKMDLASSKTDWIWAVKEGPPIKSDSKSANIQQHNREDSFTLDLTKARGGSSLNPFVAVGATTASPSSRAAVPMATAPATGASDAASSSSEGDSSSGGDSSSKRAAVERAKNAHGIILALVFVLFYPAGAMIIRLLSIRGVVWMHAGVQVFSYILALAGLGLGVYIGVTPEYQLDGYHPIIGFVVIGCLLIQPILGYVHHVMYVRQQKRTIWSTAHVWFGRIVITLGIINGGLGLDFSGNTTEVEIAYGVVAGVVWFAWVGVMIWAALYKRGGTETGSGKGSSIARGSPAMAGAEEAPRSF